MKYYCKECGHPAAPGPDGAVARSCAHTGTIGADMEAVAYGESHYADKPVVDASSLRMSLFEALLGAFVKQNKKT